MLQEKAADEVQEHYFEAFWGKPLANVIADLQVLGTPAYFAVHGWPQAGVGMPKLNPASWRPPNAISSRPGRL